MEDKFEKLNRQTFEWNNGISRSIDPTASSPQCGTKEYWENILNNRTYRQNNGQYSKRYY